MFARWAQEVAEQERELGVSFDMVVVFSVTGPTQVGILERIEGRDLVRVAAGR